LRSNTEAYELQNSLSDTTAPSGRNLYHLQFSLKAASPETFGYILVFGGENTRKYLTIFAIYLFQENATLRYCRCVRIPLSYPRSYVNKISLPVELEQQWTVYEAVFKSPCTTRIRTAMQRVMCFYQYFWLICLAARQNNTTVAYTQLGRQEIWQEWNKWTFFTGESRWNVAVVKLRHFSRGKDICMVKRCFKSTWGSLCNRRFVKSTIL
jgi:hypothetical protein